MQSINTHTEPIDGHISKNTNFVIIDYKREMNYEHR